MSLSRRAYLAAVAAGAGTATGTATAAQDEEKTTTDWTATYDGDGGASVTTLLAEGDGYLAAGTTFRGSEDDQVAVASQR
jgi:hypothetical protein